MPAWLSPRQEQAVASGILGREVLLDNALYSPSLQACCLLYFAFLEEKEKEEYTKRQLSMGEEPFLGGTVLL